VEEGDARTLTALTTEHFTLQGTRASMTAESLGRATIYLGSLSATLVVLALVAQGADSAAEFRIFALAILPGIFVLGAATFVRIIETAIEDNIAAMAINRIRGYYLELAGEEARRFFMLGAHDDHEGVLANAGLKIGLARKLDSVASVIALINSAVAGAAASIAMDALVSRGAAIAAGITVTALAGLAHIWLGPRLFFGTLERFPPLFPSEPAPPA
jgi:hypothetical protein